MTLTSVVVAAALFGILALLGGKIAATALSSSRESSAGSVTEIALQIMNQIDCQAMTAAHDLLSSSQCPSPSGGQTGPYFQLMRRKLDGSTEALFSGWNAANSSNQVGQWLIRTSCSAADNTLVVRVARLTAGGGGFYKDPVTNTVMDWDHPAATVFGRSNPLCSNRLSTATSSFYQPAQECPPGFFFAGDRYDGASGIKSPICEPWPVNACGANQVLAGYVKAGGGIQSACRNRVFGGTFLRRVYGNNDGGSGRPLRARVEECIWPNQLTGSCSCPSSPPGYPPYAQYVVLGNGRALSNNWAVDAAMDAGVSANDARTSKLAVDLIGLYSHFGGSPLFDDVRLLQNQLRAPHPGEPATPLGEGYVGREGVLCLGDGV